MQNLNEPITTLMVVTNLPDTTSAQAMACNLVEQQLAACVNILPAVRSIYRWQDAIEEQLEISLFIKTTQACYPALERLIKNTHPYEVPEIIALPISVGLPAYLDWIAQQMKKDDDV